MWTSFLSAFGASLPTSLAVLSIQMGNLEIERSLASREGKPMEKQSTVLTPELKGPRLFSTSSQRVFTERVFKLPIAWPLLLDWLFCSSCFNFSTPYSGFLESIAQTHYWSQAFCFSFSILGDIQHRWAKSPLLVTLLIQDSEGTEDIFMDII